MRARPASTLLTLVVLTVLPGLTTGCTLQLEGTPAAAAVPTTTPHAAATTSPTLPAPTPAAPTVDRYEQDVDRALAALDRRGQVAQLFVVGVPASSAGDGTDLVRDGVGGIFLAGRSAVAAGDLAATARRWVAGAPGPSPWVAADQEGGAVQTLSGAGFEDLPAALDQGRMDPQRLTGLADSLGRSLAAAGVNLDLAPVADVVPAGTEVGNAPVGAHSRQYGSSPEAVTAAAGTVVGGLAAHDVTATLKHFPGLGRVRGNTDTTAGVTDTVTRADDPQLDAFAALARAEGDPFVMASTAVYTRLDGAAPAAFSRPVLADLLRGRLGFTGVVISDDLGSAVAVQDVPVGQRAVRFLAAGGTLVLTNRTGQFGPMLGAVLARDAADPAFAATVTAAVRTALLAKARAGLL